MNIEGDAMTLNSVFTKTCPETALMLAENHRYEALRKESISPVSR
jgi:hypothetical protein